MIKHVVCEGIKLFKGSIFIFIYIYWFLFIVRYILLLFRGSSDIHSKIIVYCGDDGTDKF